MTAAKVVLLLVSLFVFDANAKDAKTSLNADDSGEIWFQSAGSLVQPSTRGGLYALSKDAVAVSGDLKFPGGNGPFPTVVLAHGCAGNGYAERTWVPLLTQWGYATFVVDSYGPRRIPSTCDNTWRLIPLERVPDVYGALRLLSTHPKIDRNAIALMGFSAGGLLTVDAATMWAKDTYVTGDGPKFRAFFPFYPYCNHYFPELDKISAPLRIHSGEADDWTPAKPCQEWTDRLKAAGFDASTTIYTGAAHAFDDPFGSVVKKSDASNAARCTPKYPSILGPYDLTKNFPSSCMSKGATVGRSQKAIEEARDVLKAQLIELMPPK